MNRFSLAGRRDRQPHRISNGYLDYFPYYVLLSRMISNLYLLDNWHLLKVLKRMKIVLCLIESSPEPRYSFQIS